MYTDDYIFFFFCHIPLPVYYLLNDVTHKKGETREREKNINHAFSGNSFSRNCLAHVFNLFIERVYSSPSWLIT